MSNDEKRTLEEEQMIIIEKIKRLTPEQLAEFMQRLPEVLDGTIKK